MEQQLPTFGQLERNLSQNIQKLYREELGHSPSKIICKFFNNQLSIVIEDALTAVEKTLVDGENAKKTLLNLSLAISDVMKSKLKTIIEEVLLIKVDDVLFDCNIKTKRAGAIIILSKPPQVRNSRPNLKIADSQDD